MKLGTLLLYLATFGIFPRRTVDESEMLAEDSSFDTLSDEEKARAEEIRVRHEEACRALEKEADKDLETYTAMAAGTWKPS